MVMDMVTNRLYCDGEDLHHLKKDIELRWTRIGGKASPSSSSGKANLPFSVACRLYGCGAVGSSAVLGAAGFGQLDEDVVLFVFRAAATFKA